MEDVLDVYERPYDPRIPMVCMDELPYEMHGDSRDPLPAMAGSDKKTDYEYVRHGTCSIFGMVEPLTGDCLTDVREHRTKKDCGEFIKKISDKYADADKIVLVWDNLNTHFMASLYEAFDPNTARQIARRFEVHYTPKHGSWLNMAEIILNVMTRECLKRRMDGIEKVRSELRAWENNRHANPKSINWQFRTSDARVKLRSLYPQL